MIGVLHQSELILLLSFLISIQADTFTKVKGLPYTSIMTTGNIKNLGTHFAYLMMHKKKQHLQNSSVYLMIIFGFLFGAFLSYHIGTHLHIGTLLASVIITEIKIAFFGRLKPK
jgi:uncharacterized membrane protein YoaK (UPF0700 family)